MSKKFYGANYRPVWAYHGDYQSYRSNKTIPFENKFRYYGSGVPFIGDFIKAYDSSNYINDYMRNRGVTWSDMKYPSMVKGSGSFGAALNSLSGDWKSFQRLYDDVEIEGKKRIRDKIARENDMWRNRYYQSAEQWYNYLYTSSRRR